MAALLSIKADRRLSQIWHFIQMTCGDRNSLELLREWSEKRLAMHWLSLRIDCKLGQTGTLAEFGHGILEKLNEIQESENNDYIITLEKKLLTYQLHLLSCSHCTQMKKLRDESTGGYMYS